MDFLRTNLVDGLYEIFVTFFFIARLGAGVVGWFDVGRFSVVVRFRVVGRFDVDHADLKDRTALSITC